jgi:hypothetical protein
MNFPCLRFLAAAVIGTSLVIVVLGDQPCTKRNDGRVTGHLRDPWCDSGVAKAAITIKGAKFKRKLKSDLSGNFDICLTPGTYQVTVEKYGFKRYIVNDLKVTSGETSPVKLDMEAGWATSDPNLGKRAPCVAPPNKSLDASGGSVFRK